MNDINKLSLAVIGGGVNSAVGFAHYSAINLSNRYNIVTGCFSRHDNVNDQSAQTYGIQKNRLYSNYLNLLEQEHKNVDAVVLLTPTNIHYNQIMDILKYNIPIICEKSLTSNFAELENVKSNLYNKFISVVFNYPCYPMLKELQKLIANQKLGKIKQILIEMPQEGFLRLYNGRPASPQSWRLVDGIVPTISLDLGMHLYSIIRLLTGATPLETVCVENNFGNFTGIVDDIHAIINYSNDIVCNMWYSKTALGHRNGLKIRIYGSLGSAEWVQIEPEYLKITDNAGNIFTLDRSSEMCQIANQLRYNRFKIGHPAGYIEALANFYEDVFQDLENYKANGDKPRNTFDINEYEMCVKLFEAMTNSAKNKCWTKI